MGGPNKCASMDRAAIERALAGSTSGVHGAAASLGISTNTLYQQMRRFGIAPPPRRPQPTRPRQPAETHPVAAQLVAEMEHLRTQARFLIHRPGPRSAQELLLIEARHRVLRDRLRHALGESEATETRGRSLAAATLDSRMHTSWRAQG